MAKKKIEKTEGSGRLVRLSDFVENPENPQTVTDEAFARLVEKLKRVPEGLTAKRIAYVTDHPAGRFVVLSGNKRLRALKKLHGKDGEVPSEWFEDVSRMTEAQRREFVVTENVVEGEWVASLLVSMFTKDELARLVGDEDVAAILDALPSVQSISPNEELDVDSFRELMTFRVKLPRPDYDRAVARLDAIDANDRGAAFMRLVKGDAQ